MSEFPKLPPIQCSEARAAVREINRGALIAAKAAASLLETDERFIATVMHLNYAVMNAARTLDDHLQPGEGRYSAEDGDCPTRAIMELASKAIRELRNKQQPPAGEEGAASE